MGLIDFKEKFVNVSLAINTYRHEGGTKFYQSIHLCKTIESVGPDASIIMFRYGKWECRNGIVSGAKFTGLQHIQSPGQARIAINSKIDQKVKGGYRHCGNGVLENHKAFDKLINLGFSKFSSAEHELKRFFETPLILRQPEEQAEPQIEIKKYINNSLYGSF